MRLKVFDLDKTLLIGTSSFEYSKFLFAHRVIGYRQMMRIMFSYGLHKWGMFSLEEGHEYIFKVIFQGREKETFVADLPRFLDMHLEKMVNPQMKEILKEAQKCGEYTALFSSSPDFVVAAIANRLKINYVESTHYEIDKHGRFVKISRLLNGEGKREALIALTKKLQIPLKDVTAYTDSIVDLPLLKTAGNAVCVNPDKELRNVAIKQGWNVLDGYTIRSSSRDKQTPQ